MNKEKRNINVSFYKDGHGFDSYRINLPVPWIRELGFTKEDRAGTLELKDDKIILKKKEVE